MMISCLCVLIILHLLQIPWISLCVEVYVSMGSNECDDRMPYNQADMPVYVCSSDEEKSRMITLQCCTNPTPLCIESSSEWWYKHVNKLNGTFQKYQEVDSTNLAPVYINNTDHPIRYLCTISASYGCEGGSGYIDIQGGSSPSVVIVNGTNVMNVTVETKALLYFEVTSHPPLLTNPYVTFNNLNLSVKWQVSYKSLDATLSNSSHFLIEITTESFMQEDSGVYSVTVTNGCSSSTETVILAAKQAPCEHQDEIHFLPGTYKKYDDYHAVEGFNVTFSYDCCGSIVSNWWEVDGYPISYHYPPYTYDYKKEISSQNGINILTLILYNVRMNYTNKYTAYPSRSEMFNNSGIKATAHLRVHRYPKFIEASLETFDDRALLGCKFIASNYSNLVEAEWRKGFGNHSFIASSSKFEQLNYKWENSECIVIQLRIKFPTQDDSGTYFCSVKYNSDIISEEFEVRSDSGRIDLDLGSKKKYELFIIAAGLAVVIAGIVATITAVIWRMRRHGQNNNHDGYEDLDNNNEENDPPIDEANFGADDDNVDAPGNDDSDIEVNIDGENDPPVNNDSDIEVNIDGENDPPVIEGNFGPNNDCLIHHNGVPRQPNASGESSLSSGNGDVYHNSNSVSSAGSSRSGNGNEVENSGNK